MRRQQKIFCEVGRYNTKIPSNGARRREKLSAETHRHYHVIKVKSISGLPTAVNLLPVNYHIWFVTGAGENTLRRLAHFLCLDHPTKSDVASGKKRAEGQNKI